MEVNTPLEELVDEVERKIGKNVLLFQRLEAILKFLLAYGSVSGYVSDLKAAHEKQVVSVDKQTLGQLVRQFNTSVLSVPEEIAKEPKELKELWFSFNFNVKSDDSLSTTWEESLELVVDERNELIHHLLPKFDLSSAHGACTAIDYLDQQRAKVLPAYEKLKQIAITLQELQRDLAEYYDSDDFKKYCDLWLLQGRRVAQLLSDIALKQARSDGWAELGAAGQIIGQEAPEELAALKRHYGQRTLKGVLQASEWFEICEEPTAKGGIRVLYREKHEQVYRATTYSSHQPEIQE